MTTHQNQSQTLDLRPFTVSIAQDAVDDLHARLDRTRYAAEPADTAGSADWPAGAPVSYLREMVAHWRSDFDWRAQEERMNALPQFLTEIDGQTVHFAHVRSANEDAVPLLLLHTYPGSFVDFVDVVPHLTDDFHLVIPSLPGVGFSQPLADGAWDSPRTARAWTPSCGAWATTRTGPTAPTTARSCPGSWRCSPPTASSARTSSSSSPSPRATPPSSSG